jgi:mono/diheme cytochrome c family protein
MSADPTRPPEDPKPGQSGFDSREDRLSVSSAHAAIMREKSEPREGREPTPLWLIALFGMLLFWGGLYLQRYSGNYEALEFDERAVIGAGARAPNAAAPVDSLVLGRRVYVNNCQVCHQGDGEGLTGQFPPLAQSEWVLAKSPERLIRILLDGMSGPVRVRGEQYNSAMPAWHDVMDDEQTAAVLTFIRQEWGNEAEVVTVDQVQTLREATQARRGRAWTEAELLAIPIEE